MTVNVIRIQLATDVAKTAFFFGKLQPNRQSRLGFGRGGKVQTVFKKVGDAVAANEVLAELDQSQLLKKKQDIEQALASARAPESAIQNRQQIETLESSLEDLKLQLANGSIVAPYECLVSQRNVDEGNMISTQIPAFEIVEKSNPVVEVGLSRMIANGLKVGQKVWIIIGTETAQAEVRSFSPSETAAGTRTVTLNVNSKLDGIPWSFGQTVEIRFFVPTDNSGYWLPLSALNRESSGLWSMYIVDQDSPNAAPTSVGSMMVSRRMVDLIQIEDNWALVNGALSDGLQVIVDGSHRIVPGQNVKPNDVTSQYSKPVALGAEE